MYDNVTERISNGDKIVNCGDREVDGIKLIEELDSSSDGYCYNLHVADSIVEATRIIDKIRDLEEVSYMMDVRHVVMCNDRDSVKRILNSDVKYTSVVTQFVESKNQQQS